MLLHVRKTESGSRFEIFLIFFFNTLRKSLFNHTMLRACGQGTPLYTVGLQSILSSTRPACRRALEASHSTLAGSVCGRNEWVLTRLRTAGCISLQVFEVARHVSMSMQRWDFQQSPSLAQIVPALPEQLVRSPAARACYLSAGTSPSPSPNRTLSTSPCPWGIWFRSPGPLSMRGACALYGSAAVEPQTMSQGPVAKQPLEAEHRMESGLLFSSAASTQSMNGCELRPGNEFFLFLFALCGALDSCRIPISTGSWKNSNGLLI